MFEQLFLQSQGKPIQYNGGTLYIADRIPMQPTTIFRICIEKADSKYRQGISLSLRPKGVLEIDGEKSKTGFHVWQDTAPSEFLVEMHGKIPRELLVFNIWEVGENSVHSGHNGAAMKIEELPNGKRYYCNDGEPDDDFNDLVFRIEKVEAKAKEKE